jgi:thioredoxin reductase
MRLSGMRKGYPALFLLHTGLSAAQRDPLLDKAYDYIVVGGGTSGLTVANRLTENGKSRTCPIASYRIYARASVLQAE